MDIPQKLKYLQQNKSRQKFPGYGDYADDVVLAG